MNCTQLKKITIPGSVTLIEVSAFESCSSLKIVQLPKDVKEIKNWSFYGFKNRQIINLENVSSICERAFTNKLIHPEKSQHRWRTKAYIQNMEEKFEH